MKYFEFENGDRIPGLGLGTWMMNDGTAYEAVKSAIRIGIAISIAPGYTRTSRMLALRSTIALLKNLSRVTICGSLQNYGTIVMSQNKSNLH